MIPADDEEASGWFSFDALDSPCLRLLDRRLLGPSERSPRRDRREGDLDLDLERHGLREDLPVCVNVLNE